MHFFHYPSKGLNKKFICWCQSSKATRNNASTPAYFQTPGLVKYLVQFIILGEDVKSRCSCSFCSRVALILPLIRQEFTLNRYVKVVPCIRPSELLNSWNSMGKTDKCSAKPHVLSFSPTHLINSRIKKPSCKILYLFHHFIKLTN